jgi:hypothetical protein
MPGRPDRDGEHQFRLLDDAWASARQHWHDGMARDFGTDHWAPLEQECRSYLEALRGLLDVLDAAERDTGD